jgi:hypothetical protein
MPDLSAPAAIDAMARFYAGERLDGVDIDNDGDMLLFQWGAYDSDVFSYDITRQVIVGNDDEEVEDEDMWQLSLTLEYPANEELATLPPGNRWCLNPGQVGALRAFIAGHASSTYLAGRHPSRVSLTFELAE